MKAILLPTDFSKNSINAINYAVKLFEFTPCEFYLLNVQKASSFISDDMMTVSSSTTIYNTLIDAAKKSLANIISQIENKNKNKHHTFHSVVDYDNFVDAINQTCENNKIDLIVMGTNGASGLEKVFFGSNTVHVIQRSKTPVLAIPKGSTFKGLDTIGFTCSFSTTYVLDDLKPLKDLATLYKSKVKVLHVIEENDYEEKVAQNVDFFQNNFPLIEYHRITSKDRNVYDSIHDFSVENKISMVTMLSKKHSFLNRLFSKHAVETFAFNIDIPLLVLKQNSI